MSQRGKTSLLGTNILRGGKHFYSADVLVENWFDQRLSPEFQPRRPQRRRYRRTPQPDDRQTIKEFTERGRAVAPTHLPSHARRTTNTIPQWAPPEPSRGHPPVTNPFETIYELTYGDPGWRCKPIPVGESLLSYPGPPEPMTTEHREAFKNPRGRPVPGPPIPRGVELEEEQEQRPRQPPWRGPLPSNRLLPTALLGAPQRYIDEAVGAGLSLPPSPYQPLGRTLRQYMPETAGVLSSSSSAHH